MQITLQNGTIQIRFREIGVIRAATAWMAQSRNASKRERIIGELSNAVEGEKGSIYLVRL